MSETCIIVGGGQAAAQLAASLRTEGFAGGITLIGEEPYPPYQRPPLSKQFLAGEVPIERVYAKPATFYQSADITLLLQTRVTAIDRAEHSVTLNDGQKLFYDKLALATGSRVRRLALPGCELDGLLYLRNIDDSRSIQEFLGPGNRLVIVGGGYIGLEVAAVAVKRGVSVTVLEMEDRVMQRTATPEIAAFYTEVHRRAGVDIRTNVRVNGFTGADGRLERVVCTDEAGFAADFAVVGVGVTPNTELAAAAGLATDNGIVVDEYARTLDPDIVAAGDCTNHPNNRLGRRLRLESVPNALAQARVAAATLCGKSKAYNEPPWFWSDQYDLKLQIVGLWRGFDQTVVRGDPGQRSFSVFCFKNGELLAVESVNNPKEFMLCKKLVAEKVMLDPTRLADASIPLQDLA